MPRMHWVAHSKKIFCFYDFLFFFTQSVLRKTSTHWVTRGRGMDWLVCNGCEDGCANDGVKRSYARRNDDDTGILHLARKLSKIIPSTPLNTLPSVQWARFMKLSHISVLSQIPHIYSLFLPIPLTLLSQTWLQNRVGPHICSSNRNTPRHLTAKNCPEASFRRFTIAEFTMARGRGNSWRGLRDIRKQKA